MLAHAATDSQSLIDAVLAIALARGERSLAVDNWDPRGRVGLHVSLIRSAGIHEFSEAEEQLISERQPRRWEHDDAEDAGDEPAEGAA